MYSPDRMESAAGDSLEGFIQLLRGLAEPIRLRILHLLLADGEIRVAHLSEALDVPQPTVSRHLGYLRRHGLVAPCKAGFWMAYALAEPGSNFHRDTLSCLQTRLAGLAELREDRARLRQALVRRDPNSRTIHFGSELCE